MPNRLRFSVAAFFHLGAGLLLATPSFAAWQNGVKYGGNTIMDLYVPAQVDASPGIVVTLHYCGGNSGNAHGWLQSAADQYGFILIAPGAGGNCFDAKPERSGEREAISKMVAYVVAQNHADPTKVFATGASSGACMTQALLAAYPEVFAGGSVLAGVPAGAWTGGNAYGWSAPSRSATEWGDIVRKASSTFTGTRPKLQLWHGTGDTTLTYSQAFPAEVLQWTNVFMVTDANSMTSSFKAQDTWARITYKNTAGAVVLETDVAQGVPHDLSGRGLWPDVVRFFGLDVDTPSGSGGSGGGGGTGGAGGAGSSTAGAGGTAGTATGGTGNAAGAPIGSGGAAGSVSSASGGSPATGGTPASTTGGGGSPGAHAGTASASAAGSGASADDAGCNLSGNPQRSGAGFAALLLAGLGVLARRRPRRSQP